MLTTIVVVVAVLIALILIVAATRPAVFRVQRSITIQAPPQTIFPLIDDFHRWSAWSPYEKLDPAMSRTLSGAPAGRGAVYAWSGNSKAGTGRMEITGSVPPSSVVVKLDFLKPFEAHNTAEFTLEPSGGGTRVTWAMHGPALFTSKLMGLFINLDRLIGRDFETGLANLKAVAEA